MENGVAAMRADKSPHFDELRSNLSSAGQNLKEAAASAVPAAQEEWQRMSEYARESAKSVSESMADCIQDRPLTWVLVAAGLGICVGMIMSKSR